MSEKSTHFFRIYPSTARFLGLTLLEQAHRSGMMHVRASGRCEACDESTATSGETTEAAFARLLMLRSPSDLEAYPIQYSDVTHSIAPDGLLAEYLFVDNVTCSFPDRQPHQHGYVVRARCGCVCSIGNHCGRRWIEGLNAALVRARNVNEALDVADLLARRPRDLLAQLDTIEPRLEGVFRFKEAAKAYLPVFYDAVMRRATRESKFTFMWRHGTSRTEFDKLGKRLANLAAKADEVSLANAHAMKLRMNAAVADAEHLISASQESYEFFTTEVLESFVVEERRSGEWFVEGSEILFRRGCNWHRLGQEGVSACREPRSFSSRIA